MPISTMDLGASLNVQEFYFKFVSLSGSLFSTDATVTIIAFGPAGTAVLENLEYEFGSVSGSVTLKSPPAGMLVPTSPEGSLTVLEWDLKADFGAGYYNKDILVSANLNDGTHTSRRSLGKLYIKKDVKDNQIKPSSVNLDSAVGASISIEKLRQR